MTQTNRLGPGRLAVFSLPVVLFQAIELGWRTYLPSFLAQSVGLSLALVGGLMVAARVLDAAADPVIGWLSDHVQTRFGLRKPWMILGAPLVSLGALGLFLAPPESRIALIVLASITLHLGYSLIVTPHGGWGLELSDDIHERTRIMGAKVWFASAGAIAILLLLALLERRFGVGHAGLVMTLGIVIALLAPISVGLVVALFQENPRRAGDKPGTPFALLRDIARIPALRRIVVLYALTGVADASSMGSFLFLCENVLGLGGWGAALMLIQPAQLLVTLPLWSRISRRFGRQRTLWLAYGWQALIMPFALVLPPGSLWILAAFLMMRNLSGGVDYMLLRAMAADLAVDDAERGMRRAGSYYAMTSITLKLAMGAGAGGMLWAIGLAGFHPGGTSTGQAEFVVRLAYAAPTIAAGLIGLFVMRDRTARLTEPTSPFLEATAQSNSG